jgi:hypothetical protein
MEEFEKLLKMALADGVISDMERELLMRKAAMLGIDEIEALMIIENAQAQQNQSPENNKKDGYDISDDELLRRIQKWTELCTKDNEKVMVEPFPKVISETTKFGNALASGQKAIGQIKDAGIVDAAASSVGFIPGAGFLTKKVGGAAVNSILGALSDTKEVKMSNEKIVSTTKQYLLILERRKDGDSFLNQKYEASITEMEKNINLFNEKKAKKKWF